MRLFPKLDVATPLVYSDQQLVCTDVLTTLNDCIRLLDVQSGLVLAESALHKNLVSVEESKELLSLPGRGSRNARAVVEQMGSLSESPGETLMMMRLRELKLPLPVQQYEMHVPWSGELFRLDAAYVQEKIALEFDGAVKMKDFGPADQVLVRERNREKTLHNLGWIVLRFSWETVLNRPAEINAVIRKAFHQRGRELR